MLLFGEEEMMNKCKIEDKIGTAIIIKKKTSKKRNLMHEKQ